jgi:hypothetical protein
VNPINPKVKAVGAAAAAATLIMWLGGYFSPELMASAPVGLEAAITALVATAAGWFKSG